MMKLRMVQRVYKTPASSARGDKAIPSLRLIFVLLDSSLPLPWVSSLIVRGNPHPGQMLWTQRRCAAGHVRLPRLVSMSRRQGQGRLDSLEPRFVKNRAGRLRSSCGRT